MLELWPRAVVVGFDLVSGVPSVEGCYRVARGDLLEGLPFTDDSFDFVHQRFLSVGIPLKHWQAALAELVRVTAPGGWVELVEMSWAPKNAGPAVQAVAGWGRRLATLRELDTNDVIFLQFQEHLCELGPQDVQRLDVGLPIGEWAGQRGYWMKRVYSGGFTGIGHAVTARLGISERQWQERVEAAMDEVEDRRVEQLIAFAWGRKPH